MGTFTRKYIAAFLRTAQYSDAESNFFNEVQQLKPINEQNNDDRAAGFLSRSWVLQGIVHIPKSMLLNGDISALFKNELSDPAVIGHIPVINEFLSSFWSGYDETSFSGELISVNKDPSREDAWNVSIKVTANVQLEGNYD